jgi:hypothetical protein
MGIVLVLTTFLAASVLQMNVPLGMAQRVNRANGVIFDVLPTGVAPTSLPTAPGSPFSIQGNIYRFRTINQATCEVPAGAEVLGTWRAWGEIAEDGSRLLTSQSYTLDAFNGQIDAQGPSGMILARGGLSTIDGVTTGPTEIISVTGGFGFFRGAQGEAHIRPYCSDPPRPFRYDRAFCFSVVGTVGD